MEDIVVVEVQHYNGDKTGALFQYMMPRSIIDSRDKVEKAIRIREGYSKSVELETRIDKFGNFVVKEKYGTKSFFVTVTPIEITYIPRDEK